MANNGEAPAAVQRALRDALSDISRLENAVRTDEPDAVHDVRVALRTMRAVLTIFGPALADVDLAPLRRELRWAGRQLADARDLEVLRERFGEELPVGSASQWIADDLTRRHSLDHARGVEALDDPRWSAMKALATQVLDSPLPPSPQEDPRDVLRDLIHRYVERQVLPRLARAESDPVDLHLWHEVRKAVKSTRYAWELIASLPAADDDDRACATDWKTAGSALGDLQDTAVALDTVGQYLEAPPERDDVVRVLIEFQNHLRRTADAQLRTAGQRLGVVVATDSSSS